VLVAVGRLAERMGFGTRTLMQCPFPYLRTNSLESKEILDLEAVAD
jgi:hypothetical protein